MAVSIIIALALLSFIIDPSTLETAMNSMSSKYDVGKIAGKTISYTEFQENIDRLTTVNQIITNSSVQSEEMQEQIRDNAWQSLIDRYMFVKNAKKAGINVGESELIDLTMGANPSPVIAGSGLFSDASGQFSVEAVKDFVKNLDADNSGSYRMLWEFLTSNVQTQQYYSKYGALFTNSNIENQLMINRDIADNNNTYNVDFVLKPFPVSYDSTIVVPASDIKKYYDAHKNDFKRVASRDIDYVLFEVIPSEKDKAEARKEFNELYEEFAAAENVKSFILRNSEQAYSEYWYRDGELNTISPDINTYAFSGSEGISDPFAEGNYLRAAKVFGSAMVSDSVYVKHMLFQGSDAANLADSLLNVLRHGGDFSSLAALYSDDKNSAVDGQFGNLGWMTQTYILPGFESIITAKIGEPYVLETRYGTHIVEVVKATKPVLKKQVAILEKSTIASNETYNTFYSQANSFATLANGKLEGFRKAADSLKVYVHPVDGVTESTSNYGPIDQAKEVTRWAFDAKKGSVSNVIKVNNNYFFVAALREIHKEGITPLEDMSQAIERVLYAKAVAQKENESVKEKIQGLGSLEEIATALNTTVSTDQSVVASAMGSATTDPALAGAVSVSKEGKICGPVSGSMGTYVFVVNGHDTAAFYTESDAKSLAQRKGQYVAQQIVPVMMMDNDVVDNRARFF